MSEGDFAELKRELELFASLAGLAASATGEQRVHLIHLRGKVQDTILSRYQAACAASSAKSPK